MTPRNRMRLLLVIFVVLLGYLGWNKFPRRFMLSDRQIVGRGNSLSGIESRVSEALPDRYPSLLLGALDHKPATYSPGRDPFRYAIEKSPQNAAAQPPKNTTPAKPETRQGEAKKSVAKEIVRPRPPNIDLKYLGSFGLKQRPIAVFVKDGDIINAITGEVLEETLIVDSIGYESVEVRFVDFPDEPARRLAAGG